MSKEPLTHSETYLKKTNRIILTVGITSLLIFIFGLALLLLSNDPMVEYEAPNFTDNDDALNITDRPETSSVGIEFGNIIEEEIPLTTTPNPVPLGQVVIGTDAKNVLTLGTNGRSAVKILSVTLADPPADGFSFTDGCSDITLQGDDTCHIQIAWVPVVAGNVQNNFVISWQEVGLGQGNAKAEKVPVIGNAVNREDCSYCEPLPGTENNTTAKARAVRYAIGPDGNIIGEIDSEGYGRDSAGNVIGRVNSNGLVLDKDGNVIGVAQNRQIAIDSNGNVIGTVNPDGAVTDSNGNIIGKVLADGSVVDSDNNIIGRVADTGLVYNNNGDIIGRVMPDGTVVDSNGNIIGRLNGQGEVVDGLGNIIGYVSSPGQVAVDAKGNSLGVVMPDGSVVDADGNTVGYVDKNSVIDVLIKPLDRIAQIVICPIFKPEVMRCDELSSTKRGAKGFGSSGKE